MRSGHVWSWVGIVLLAWTPAALAYPGGTPSYQTDVAPYCAGCHASRSQEMLEGAPDRAQKELSERKHIALVLAGQQGYASLTEPDRQVLADQLMWLNQRTFQADQAAIEEWAGQPAPLGAPLLQAARRGYAMLAAACARAQEANVPLIVQAV